MLLSMPRESHQEWASLLLCGRCLLLKRVFEDTSTWRNIPIHLQHSYRSEANHPTFGSTARPPGDDRLHDKRRAEMYLLSFHADVPNLRKEGACTPPLLALQLNSHRGATTGAQSQASDVDVAPAAYKGP